MIFRTMKKILFTLVTIVTLLSCGKEKVEWIQLEDFTALDPTTCFIPYAVYDDDLKDSFAGTKTTSVTIAQMGQEFLSRYLSGKVRSYCGTYMGENEHGEPVRMSGRIIVPTNKKVSRILLLSHYTITDDASAPSNALPFEAVFAPQGLAIIAADYLGYGLTKNMMHPYLIPDQAARDVVNMYFAALPFLEAIGAKPKHDDILLMGYSQGGAMTMAVQTLLEQCFPETKIRLNMSGAGPHDLCLTYDKMVEEDYAMIPVVIPMVLRTMKYSCGLDRVDLKDYIKPEYLDNLEKWIDSKAYSADAITEMLGTHKLSKILTPSAMNKVSPAMEDMYLAMKEQSILYPENFMMPQAPVYLFHSMDDETVPFENSVELLDYIQGISDVYYNFGHYGGHVDGMIRFIQGCLDLLEEKGDI